MVKNPQVIKVRVSFKFFYEEVSWTKTKISHCSKDCEGAVRPHCLCGADDKAQATASERKLLYSFWDFLRSLWEDEPVYAKSDADIIIIKEVVDKDTGKHNGENK